MFFITYGVYLGMDAHDEYDWRWGVTFSLP